MKRRTTNKIVYELREMKTNDTDSRTWVCVENTANPQYLGVQTINGVPNPLHYAVGSRHTIKTEVPE